MKQEPIKFTFSCFVEHNSFILSRKLSFFADTDGPPMKEPWMLKDYV